MDLALLKALAVEQAIAKRLDPDLVLAICEVESAWDQWAVRYEAGWHYFLDIGAYAMHLNISSDTERICQSMSYGVMQVMGSVARELGYKDALVALPSQPALAMHLGVCHLAKMASRYGPDPSVLSAAYNAGSPRKTAGGMFYAQGYVDKVARVLARLKAGPNGITLG